MRGAFCGNCVLSWLFFFFVVTRKRLGYNYYIEGVELLQFIYGEFFNARS